MTGKFFGFKFYFSGLIILVLIFFFSWFPKMEVEMKVVSEPLIFDFNVDLDIFANNILTTLNTLPAKKIKEQEKDNYTEYYFSEELFDKQEKTYFSFKKKDLEKFIKEKTNDLLTSFKSEYQDDIFILGKQVVLFHPHDWSIEVLEKDFSKGRVLIKVGLQEEVIYCYNLEEIKKEIIFKDKNWAKEKIEKLSRVKEAVVKISPPFWPQTPLFSKRIIFLIHPVNY